MRERMARSRTRFSALCEWRTHEVVAARTCTRKVPCQWHFRVDGLLGAPASIALAHDRRKPRILHCVRPLEEKFTSAEQPGSCTVMRSGDPHSFRRRSMQRTDREAALAGQARLPVGTLPDDFDGIPLDGEQYLAMVR